MRVGVVKNVGVVLTEGEVAVPNDVEIVDL
jgi:hypothetical protein